MPTAQALHDQAVVHRAGLNRYSNALVRSVIALLNRTDADIVARISRDDLTDFQDYRWRTLLSEVRHMQAEAWVTLGETFTGHLDDLAGAEADFSRRLVEVGAGLVNVELQSMRLSTDIVIAAVKARPFSGRLLSEWLADTEDAAANRVRNAIRMGAVEGQTVDEIVRRIRGTKAARYQDGILEINRRAAESMVRTAVTHVASTAAQETYAEAGDLIEGIEWVSTLDSRTSKTCAGLDGQVFPLDKGPRPPAHIGCRSTTIPRIKGLEPFERTTFEAWLKGQPRGVQDDVLGPTRVDLWLRGRLDLSKMVDDRGEVLTLDELRQRDAAAFKRAGL